MSKKPLTAVVLNPPALVIEIIFLRRFRKRFNHLSQHIILFQKKTLFQVIILSQLEVIIVAFCLLKQKSYSSIVIRYSIKLLSMSLEKTASLPNFVRTASSGVL